MVIARDGPVKRLDRIARGEGNGDQLAGTEIETQLETTVATAPSNPRDAVPRQMVGEVAADPQHDAVTTWNGGGFATWTPMWPCVRPGHPRT